MTLKIADFFCGAGGFSEGFRLKGFDIIFALDNWRPAIATHKLNHPECNSVQMDILKLDTPEKIDEAIPDTDIIIGSPPCVSFSGSNKAGKADKTLGIRLIEAYLRIVAWKKSKGKVKYWILENVPNSSKFIKEQYTWKELGLPGQGPTLKIPVRQFLNAADYGVPQTRRRFFCGEYPVPEKTNDNNWITLEHVMSSLTSPERMNRKAIIEDPNFKNLKIGAEELTDHFYDTKVERFEWEKAKRMKRDHGFMGRMSFPENIKKPSRTIMATRSASTREAMILGNGSGYRMPTIREIASIMSFPITYQFEGSSEEAKYKQVGNAVCPKLIAAIAEAIGRDYGMKMKEGYIISDSIPKISFNLNGTKKEKKTEKPKRFCSKFAVHVPEMKIRSFRVELSNLNSDFGNEKIRWECVLHQGSGKHAKKCITDSKNIEKLIRIWNRSILKDYGGNFIVLTNSINELKKRIPDSKTFQELYCRINNDDKYLNPMETLEEIRKAVDRSYPNKTFDDMTARNENNIIPINKDNIPVRILMAFYSCNKLIDAQK